MKKYNILLVMAIALLLGSCYDLDRSPFDSLSSTNFWQTEAQCKEGLMGAYSALKAENMLGSDFQFDKNTDIEYGAFKLLNESSSYTSWIADRWSAGYEAVHRANLAIRRISAADIDEAVKNQMVGEAHFLRALSYFFLMNHFGGVPLYDENDDLEKIYDNMNKLRSSEEETRAFIIKDLEDASKDGLPDAWDKNNYGRVTQSAVYALLGKVYLYNYQYDKALENFMEVIKPEHGHALNPNYASLFTLAGDASSEMIFSLMNYGGTGYSLGMPLVTYFGNSGSYGNEATGRLKPTVEFVDSYEYKDGRPFSWDDIFPGYTTDMSIRKKVFVCTVTNDGKIVSIPEEKDKILAMYDQRDPRMKASIILPYTTYLGSYQLVDKTLTYLLGQNSNGIIVQMLPKDGYVGNDQFTYLFRKYAPEGSMSGKITDASNSPVNFPIIRLADVYLMMAECYNQTGNQDKAVEYINLVRQRAGVALLNSGPSYLEARTKEAVFNRIVRERAFELCGEGQREGDLKRWELIENLNGKVVNGITGTYQYTKYFDVNRDYLWPIPQADIEKNPGLTQNPNW